MVTSVTQVVSSSGRRWNAGGRGDAGRSVAEALNCSGYSSDYKDCWVSWLLLTALEGVQKENEKLKSLECTIESMHRKKSESPCSYSDGIIAAIPHLPESHGRYGWGQSSEPNKFAKLQHQVHDQLIPGVSYQGNVTLIIRLRSFGQTQTNTKTSNPQNPIANGDRFVLPV